MASQTDGTSTPTKVTLGVTVPATATAGTTRIVVHGVTTAKSTDSLILDVRVSPNAAGSVTLTTDTPQLKGASDTSFTFSLTLTNSTADDLPFSATATGPDGWTVTAQVGTQRAGGERGRQGRQQHARDRDRQACRWHGRRRLPDRGRRDERQPDGPRGPPGHHHR